MYWNRETLSTPQPAQGLIETWDVLKCGGFGLQRGRDLINRNMRCIEIPILSAMHIDGSKD